MASKVARAGGFQVKWRKGRDPWQTEFFNGPDGEYAADRFKLDVEHAGNAWPAGWVSGLGCVTPTEVLTRDDTS